MTAAATSSATWSVKTLVAPSRMSVSGSLKILRFKIPNKRCKAKYKYKSDC